MCGGRREPQHHSCAQTAQVLSFSLHKLIICFGPHFSSLRGRNTPGTGVLKPLGNPCLILILKRSRGGGFEQRLCRRVREILPGIKTLEFPLSQSGLVLSSSYVDVWKSDRSESRLPLFFPALQFILLRFQVFISPNSDSASTLTFTTVQPERGLLKIKKTQLFFTVKILEELRSRLTL